MKKKHYLISSIILVGIGLLWFRGKGEDAPNLMTTTSVLSSIAEDIAGEKVKVTTLVPAGSCPGHFDVKVQHLRLIEESGMLLAHGFEAYLPDIRRSVGNPAFNPSLIQIRESWLTKPGMTSLYNQVAEELISRFPSLEQSITAELKKARKKIEDMGDDVRQTARELNTSEIKVICNSHLRGFMDYAGFDVVATYGRREDLSPTGITNIIGVGKEEGARIVIDNMQAGADTGKVFSEELGVPHVAISNFPGALTGADTLYETLLLNLELIEKSLE